MKPYFQDEGITLFCGDCLAVLDGIGSVDLVATDPPYNVGLTYQGDESGDKMAHYDLWCASWFLKLKQRAKTIALTPGSNNVGMWYRIAPPDSIAWWVKSGICRGEPILLWGERAKAFEVLIAPIRKLAECEGHPCPKPELFAKRLIAYLSKEGETVLDPFSGTGTILKEARLAGRKAIGIERDDGYCKIAVARMAQGVLALSTSTASMRLEERSAAE